MLKVYTVCCIVVESAQLDSRNSSHDEVMASKLPTNASVLNKRPLGAIVMYAECIQKVDLKHVTCCSTIENEIYSSSLLI